MTVSVAQFRADLTEFGSSTLYPSSDVTFYLNLAYKMLNPQRWGNLLDTAAELFAAHNLALEKRAKDESAAGAPPGTTTGIISGRSVDKASVNYDGHAAVDETAGHWNLTVYGLRFWNMVKMFGAGPVQVGAGSFIPGGAFLPSAMAWSGPPVMPGWLGS